ncbi:MAG: hypothetical protein BWY75_03870 [bacterium ADurb.Bin425]|nr:MAG: hypothetical protein BWY75_03870 [bacterium ADurb.Bin425]
MQRLNIRVSKNSYPIDSFRLLFFDFIVLHGKTIDLKLTKTFFALGDALSGDEVIPQITVGSDMFTITNTDNIRESFQGKNETD